MVEPPEQAALTYKTLVFLRSLSDEVVYWQDTEKFYVRKSRLLNLSDLDIVCIRHAITNAQALIDAKKYRSAHQELSATKPCFDTLADSSVITAHARGNSYESHVIESTISAVLSAPMQGQQVPAVVGPSCTLNSSRLSPTPVLPIQKSFIHFVDTGWPLTGIDLERSSTVPAKSPRPWDDSSTCGGESDGDDSGTENGNCEVFGISLSSEIDAHGSTPQVQEQSSSISSGAVIVDQNMGGSLASPMKCTSRATHSADAARSWVDSASLRFADPNWAVSGNLESRALLASSREQELLAEQGAADCFVIEREPSTLLCSKNTRCVINLGEFTVVILPRRVNMKRGGSSFKASKGQCNLEVKRNSTSGGLFTIAVGFGFAPVHIRETHDFSTFAVFNVPGTLDLRSARDVRVNLIRLTFEFTPVQLNVGDCD